MPLIKIKKYVFERRLSVDRERLSRKLKLRSWNEIKTIGFLYVVPDEQNYIRFTNFVGRLQSQKKEIRALGLLKNKDIPHYCYPRIAFDYFSKKDVSWYGKPGGVKVDDFVKIEFDLLINIESCDNHFFNYIVALSKAHLKAGRYSESCTHIYDVMINDEGEKDYEKLFEQIIGYLNVLRKS
jgi:hypothetical protein